MRGLLGNRKRRLFGVVADESHDHAVQVEEEEEQMETELDKRLLCVRLVPALISTRTQTRARHTFLWTLSFLKISVASRRWVLSIILGSVSFTPLHSEQVAPPQRQKRRRIKVQLEETYFLALYARRGRLRTTGSQYPLMRNRKVRKAWTAASGMI